MRERRRKQFSLLPVPSTHGSITQPRKNVLMPRLASLRCHSAHPTRQGQHHRHRSVAESAPQAADARENGRRVMTSNIDERERLRNPYPPRAFGGVNCRRCGMPMPSSPCLSYRSCQNAPGGGVQNTGAQPTRLRFGAGTLVGASESKHSPPPALPCPALICPIRKCGRLHARRRGAMPAIAHMPPANPAATPSTSARAFSTLHTDDRGMACTGSAISAMCTDAGTARHQKCGMTRANTAWAHRESA